MKMSYYEALMLVCFGISWPISIMKSLRKKVVIGKSPLFMLVISAGYIFGILHKYFYAMDWVIYLYMVNVVLVLTDLGLYYYYRGISCENGTHQPSI